MFLRQNTAQVIKVGPFLDDTDGNTAETALTLTNTDFRLSKDGGNFGSSSSGSATHDELGYYDKTLSTTDTNTVGELVVAIHESGALAVTHRYWVLEEAVYDAYFGASAVGYVSSQVAASVTGAVGSVTGAVGSVTARVTANVDQLDGASIATHVAGHFPSDLRYAAGVALASASLPAAPAGEITGTVSTTSNTPTTCSTNLVSQGFTTDDIFKNRTIEWLDGSTLYGALSFIHAYDGSTGVLTFSHTPNDVAPVNTDTFRIL